MEEKKIIEIAGANMDIDLVSENVDWNQGVCPWNKAENTKGRDSFLPLILAFP